MIQDLLRWLSEPGFFGTPAPRFSDLVLSSLVVVVGLLVLGIGLARRGRHALHGWTMSGTWAILSLVVVAFVYWNEWGGPPPAPRLEASSLHGRVYLPLLAVHIVIAVVSLLLAPATAWLGWLHHRGVESISSPVLRRLARRHAVAGKTTFGLLLFTAVSGMTIYYFRYLF